MFASGSTCAVSRRSNLRLLAAAIAVTISILTIFAIAPVITSASAATGMKAAAKVKPARLGWHYVTKKNGADLHRGKAGEVIWLLEYGQRFDVVYSPEGVWCEGEAPGIIWFEERDAEAWGWVLCGDLNA